jgi:hypothetical protein
LENGAQGAPRRGSAYSPTGFRRLTPGLLKVDRTAESFAGLPDGVTAHGQFTCGFQGRGAQTGAVDPTGICGRLAVQIYPAAGLGAGRAADRMALGPVAAGGARPFRNPGEAAQPLPDRGGPRHDEGQPQRQALRQARSQRPDRGGLRLRLVTARCEDLDDTLAGDCRALTIIHINV